MRGRCEPSANSHNFRLLADVLQHRQPGGETSLADVFEGLLSTLKRRGLVVLISDCFDRLDRR